MLFSVVIKIFEMTCGFNRCISEIEGSTENSCNYLVNKKAVKTVSHLTLEIAGWEFKYAAVYGNTQWTCINDCCS